MVNFSSITSGYFFMLITDHKAHTVLIYLQLETLKLISMSKLLDYSYTTVQGMCIMYFFFWEDASMAYVIFSNMWSSLNRKIGNYCLCLFLNCISKSKFISIRDKNYWRHSWMWYRGMQPLNFLLILVMIVTKMYVLKCDNMFSGIYSK